MLIPLGSRTDRTHMSDESRIPSAEQIFMLSEEVSRIAERLASLSTNVSQPKALPSTAPKLEVPIDVVRSAVKARRLRTNYFSENLFADQAWDMMLELLVAELSGQRIAVSTLSDSAAIPPSTAIRWINSLVQQGLFVRRDDPLDGRRVFVELAPETSVRLRQYFFEII